MVLYVIDDHPLMREAIALLLRRQWPGAEVVELDRLKAMSHAVQLHGDPQLICLDLRLPDCEGVQGVQMLRTRFPATALAVISASLERDVEELCLQAGADVFVQKSAGAHEILTALHTLLTPDSGFDRLPEDVAPQEAKLSRRQLQLLHLIEQGLSNREIAAQLSISEHTVKVHLWRLFKRLDVSSRTQAIHAARKLKLFSS